jgi:hypothetical protein
LREEGARRAVEVHGDRGHAVLPAERDVPGEQLVEHDARRVEVRARVDALAEDLLGAHVRRGPDDRAREGARVGGARLEALGDAEVEHLDLAVGQH